MIKKVLIIPVLIIILANTTMARTIRDFNFDWKFKLGDYPTANQQTYDDSSWRSLKLPHDWSIEQSYTTQNTAGSTAFLPTGKGWYRKTFTVSEAAKDSLIHIEFDGIMNNAEVWINGHFLGKRPYGYSVFGYELTPHLHFGEKNTLAVKVDHSQFADSRWYAGSGIYRDVRLVTTSNVFIPQFGAWWETPAVTENEAKVNITTVIHSQEKKTQKLQVNLFLKDSQGNTISEESSKVKVSGVDTIKIKSVIPNPTFWSIENPALYTAEIQILNGDELLDSYHMNLGVRTFKFTADKGFYLNGENIELKGVCLHHDAGAVGAIFIKDVWKRRLERLKEIGVNAIRSSHNPADPGFLKLCDEMGFVVINEAFDEWKRNKGKWITTRFANDMRSELEVGYGDIFEEWAEQDIKDMVRYSRNHPSIIMWSLGNEIEWTYPYYWKMEKSNQGLGNQVLHEETGDGVDELKETAVVLQDWIKELDLSRPVTSGGVLPRAGGITGYFDVPDVMGYNYRAINYDEDHQNFPDRIIYGSENWGTYQEWKDAVDRDFVAGVFVWTGIAYLGESGPFPWKGLEISFMDFAGFYTPRGHFFRTLWNDEPYTYLATQHAKKAHWQLKNGQWEYVKITEWLDKWLFEDVDPTWNYNKGDSVFVEVYSNSPEVELFVNDQSYGIQRPADFEDHIVKFLVPYSDGTVKAIGLKNGEKESEYFLKTAKWINKIELTADKTTMSANGYDVVHIEANLMNNGGSIIPDKKMQIEFTVEGEGVNIGVDNGWERNVQDHQSNYIVTHNGKVLLLVQSTTQTGEIKITARSGKLQSNEVIIQTE